jgi:hypothetical protein
VRLQTFLPLDYHADHLSIQSERSAIPSVETFIQSSRRFQQTFHQMDIPQSSTADGGCEPLSEEDRQRKVRSLRDQLARYEKPSERLWEMVVGQPSLNAAVKICLDVSLFESWAEVCGGTLANEQLTLTELSWLVSIEIATMSKSSQDVGYSQLIPSGRVLQHLVSYGVIQEVDTEVYAQTTLSRALCDPSMRAGMLY